MEKHDDENYEKPSRHKQWQEKSSRPIISKPMTREDIEEHRLNLARSYQCEPHEIVYDFHKITDENDEDRDDCLWLKYSMKCIVDSKLIERDIFSLKIPIPVEVKLRADQLRRQQAMRRSTTPTGEPLMIKPKIRKPQIKK